MKKMPTLFQREFEGHNVKKCLPSIPFPEGTDILLHGIPTIKYDGACCMIWNTVLYKRYDAKMGKQPPADAIPCQPMPDPVTGHWPHWVPVSDLKPEDRWFIEAYNNSKPTKLIPIHEGQQKKWNLEEYEDGTYEAVGPHFQGNPYGLDKDYLYKHGSMEIKDLERTFTGVRHWLESHNEEGIIFWYNGEPAAKIKRTDFGFEWKGRKQNERSRRQYS